MKKQLAALLACALMIPAASAQASVYYSPEYRGYENGDYDDSYDYGYDYGYDYDYEYPYGYESNEPSDDELEPQPLYDDSYYDPYDFYGYDYYNEHYGNGSSGSSGSSSYQDSYYQDDDYVDRDNEFPPYCIRWSEYPGVEFISCCMLHASLVKQEFVLLNQGIGEEDLRTLESGWEGLLDDLYNVWVSGLAEEQAPVIREAQTQFYVALEKNAAVFESETDSLWYKLETVQCECTRLCEMLHGVG